MNTFELRKKIGLNVFTVNMIKPLLELEYKQPLIKINAMVKKGDLLQLKRGVYAFNSDYRDYPLNLIAVANLLHRPSYVSFEYALSNYGLIPERVYTITSATSYKSWEYSTEIGKFSYTKISSKVYSLGLEYKYDDRDGGYLIATVEKALCDKLYQDGRIKELKSSEIMEYLENDLRIEWGELKKLDTTLMWKISMAYSSTFLQKVTSTIAKRKKHV
ncbi:MAG: hypothetical protein QM497_02715 [Sulfurimonas sp.]